MRVKALMSHQLTPFHEILSTWSKQNAVPLNISIIDEILGGILPYHLQSVVGDSGVGKTWFCLNAIFRFLEQEPDAQVLYNDFGGNFRITNLSKLLSSSRDLDQITIFQPKSLLEQIIFFRNLLEVSEYSFNLIILDSLFGSPLTALEYFQKEPKFWEKKIFSHLLDLKNVTREWNIPILLTNHLIPARENSETISSLNQYGGYILEQFIPIEFFIQKTKLKNCVEVRIFQNIVGRSDFVLGPLCNE